jgi:5-formyltetrahydrofolate cyclo-ligase
MDTKALRAANKAKRNQLDPETVAALSVEITGLLWRIPVLARAKRIACYFPIGGEVDCQFATRTAWNRGREVFLPVLRGPELIFTRYRPDTELLRNRYGIPEPRSVAENFFRPQEIDVVLTPLVAFDENGNRIGMGAGFYDRSFRFMRHRISWTRPHLVGLAYDFQKVPQLKACSWDIPLQTVVTEKKIYSC